MSSKSGRRGSLAARLTVWYTLSAFAVVLAAAGLLYGALAANLEREDAEVLDDQVGVLRVLLREYPGDLRVLKQEVEVETAAPRNPRVLLRILSEDGRILTETPGMGRELPPADFPDPADGRAAERRGASGKPFETVAARAEGHVIHVALDATRERELLADFRWRMLAVLAGALVLSALVGHRIARRGIRPVEEIAETARRIRSSTLNERIEADRLPSELASLAETMNGMLARLEDAFARLSRFSADIAHELRTPLNTLRGEAEVALGRPRTPEEYREALGSCLEEGARLSRLVDSLLFLARAEHPDREVRREPVGLAGELESIRGFYEAAAAEKGVRISAAAPGDLVVPLDRTLFQRAAGNLIENALAHTPPGGSVVLRGARDDGRVLVEVSDTGSGIGPEHLPHVFDRLYRADRSRSAATGGAGLGLAIVKSIAELHGGTVSIASEPGKGTRVTLLLPGASPANDRPFSVMGI